MFSIVLLSVFILQALAGGGQLPVGESVDLAKNMATLAEDKYKDLKVSLHRPLLQKAFQKLSRSPKKPNLIIADNMFLGRYKIAAPVDFMSMYLDGSPIGPYHSNTLVKIASPSINFLNPERSGEWKVGQSRYLYSNAYVDLKKYTRNSVLNNKWENELVFDRQIRVTATKSQVKGSREEVIVINNLEVLPGPLYNPNILEVVSRPFINTEPVIYGGVKTWIIPNVQLEGVEVRGTAEFAREWYYGIAGPEVKIQYFHVIPSDGVQLFRTDFDTAAEGASCIMGTKTYAFRGQYTRATINSEWQYHDTKYYQIKFYGTKHKDPATNKFVAVLNGKYELVNKP